MAYLKRSFRIGVKNCEKYAGHKYHKYAEAFELNMYTDGGQEITISYSQIRDVSESKDKLVVLFVDGSTLAFDLTDIEYYNLTVDSVSASHGW